jgi:C4-dicarboxylate transporter DctM subunit
MVIMIWAVIFLIITLLLGIPLPYCFGGALGIMVYFAKINTASLFVWGYSSMVNASLIAGPLFILCGGFIDKAKIAEKLLDLVGSFTTKVRGGLGMISVATCAFLGAISGSAFTGVAAIGPTMHPKMVEAGYPRGYAASLIAASTLLGVLIPPSLPLIIFGWATGVSVLACFLSTVFPGLLIATVMCLVNYIDCGRFKKMTEISAKMTYEKPTADVQKERRADMGRKFITAIPSLMMPVIILGGIYGGAFTPSEAAAVAVLVCLIIGVFLYRNLNLKSTYSVLKSSVASTGAIMVMMFFCYMLSQTFVILKLPEALVAAVTSFTESKIVVLLLVNLLLAFLGMVVNDGTAIVLCAPLLIPLCGAYGVHPVQVAAIMVTNLSFGGLTPPYASVLYLTMRVCNVAFDEILPSTLKFVLLAYLPVTLLTTFVPSVSLWLPRALSLL